MGVAFQFPILIFALAKLNIVSAKALGKGWRYSLVAISILAAMITPTVDPVNMVLLMAPLFILYLLSVLVAYIATGKSKSGNGNSEEEIE
jgi:sec-independent protein translocase protein TatC